MKLLNRRLRELRLSLGLSQEAIGAQGFVSTPGWAKIENGTRQPSDNLLERLVSWLIHDNYLSPHEGDDLLEELLTLKYMGHLSSFVRKLARANYERIQMVRSELKVAEESDETSSVKPPVRQRKSRK